jgi:hypothetical protein
LFFDDTVKSYDANGVATGFSLDIAPQMSVPRGIAFDGVNLWIGDYATPNVFKYTKSGRSLSYSGFSFSVSGQLPVGGALAYDGNGGLWVVISSGLAADNGKVHRYTLSGVYTGISFDADPEVKNPLSMVFHDGLWITDNFVNNDTKESKFYKYINGSGGGGAGINVGVGSAIGSENGKKTGEGGLGSTIGSFKGGTGGNWGRPGEKGSGSFGHNGGLAGKGIAKNGATVRIFGATPINFINGVGEQPDL